MTMEDEKQALDAVAHAMLRRTGVNRAELTLSNGIVLRYKAVPPALTNAVSATLERQLPRVPTVYIPEKGRDEENPNDPEYLAAMEAAQQANQIAMEDLMCAAGTDVVSWPPELAGPDDDAWLEDSRVRAAVNAGLQLRLDNPDTRKVAYIRYYALETYVDAMLHSRVSLEVQGIREEDVEAAMAGFRSDEERAADREPSPAAGDEDGDRPNRAARRARPRDRSA